MTDDVLGCFKLNCQATSSYRSDRLGPIGLGPTHCSHWSGLSLRDNRSGSVGPSLLILDRLDRTRTGPRPRLSIPVCKSMKWEKGKIPMQLRVGTCQPGTP